VTPESGRFVDNSLLRKIYGTADPFDARRRLTALYDYCVGKRTP
jgi:hypothetical protein